MSFQVIEKNPKLNLKKTLFKRPGIQLELDAFNFISINDLFLKPQQKSSKNKSNQIKIPINSNMKYPPVNCSAFIEKQNQHKPRLNKSLVYNKIIMNDLPLENQLNSSSFNSTQKQGSYLIVTPFYVAKKSALTFISPKYLKEKTETSNITSISPSQKINDHSDFGLRIDAKHFNSINKVSKKKNYDVKLPKINEQLNLKTFSRNKSVDVQIDEVIYTSNTVDLKQRLAVQNSLKKILQGKSKQKQLTQVIQKDDVILEKNQQVQTEQNDSINCARLNASENIQNWIEDILELDKVQNQKKIEKANKQNMIFRNGFVQKTINRWIEICKQRQRRI